ncbi:MAG: hypothetical protein V1872_04695 [bacterium]
MNKKIVIIGGSAAGPKAAARARRFDQEADITYESRNKSEARIFKTTSFV